MTSPTSTPQELEALAALKDREADAAFESGDSTKYAALSLLATNLREEADLMAGRGDVGYGFVKADRRMA